MRTRAERAARPGRARAVWSLLRKDLRVFDTRDAAVFLGLYVLVGAQVAPWDEAFFWIGAGLAGALVAIVPIAEWILDTDRLVGSLPVRRATVVVARYMWAVAACAGAASVWVAGGHLLAPLLATRPTAPATWESLDGVLAGAAIWLALSDPVAVASAAGEGDVAALSLAILKLLGRGLARLIVGR